MRLVDIKCVWCDRFLWPFQKLSPGGSMHIRCFDQVQMITWENQQQYLKKQDEYLQRQAELRWEQEDRL